VIYPKLEDAVATIEQALPTEISAGEVAEWFAVQQLIDSYVARLKSMSGLIGGMMAEAVPREKGATIVSEGKTFRRTGTPSRKGWRNDELLVAVLDSRLFKPGTGELVDESPVEKILAVWNLGSPRTTALTARGIDADEFCVVEWSNRGVAEVVS
jgi:hypothetical protein